MSMILSVRHDSKLHNFVVNCDANGENFWFEGYHKEKTIEQLVHWHMYGFLRKFWKKNLNSIKMRTRSIEKMMIFGPLRSDGRVFAKVRPLSSIICIFKDKIDRWNVEMWEIPQKTKKIDKNRNHSKLWCEQVRSIDKITKIRDFKRILNNR